MFVCVFILKCFILREGIELEERCSLTRSSWGNRYFFWCRYFIF